MNELERVTVSPDNSVRQVMECPVEGKEVPRELDARKAASAQAFVELCERQAV